MKRFYCTVCKRIKRVRKYPTIIQSVDSTAPANRIGQCNHHASGYIPKRQYAVAMKAGR